MPTDALTVVDRGVVSDLEQRFHSIATIMARLMTEGLDYGIIPGTGDKPTLYKSGAEKLLVAFSLAAVDPGIEDLSTGDEIRYRVRVPIETGAGRVVGVGCGEASSNEEKYRWRRPVCDDEWTETAPDLRREKWMRGKTGAAPWKAKQVRTSPADVSNTILKMAHKRALIHGALMATAASSIFNQGLEDLTADLRDAMADDEPGAAPAAPAPAKTVRRASTYRAGSVTPSSSAAPAADLLTTDARLVKAVRPFGTGNFAILLDGDKQEYTTKNETVAAEIKNFLGTAHAIRISYRDNVYQGTTYHNIQNIVIADEPPAPHGPATATPPSADDIPFGGR